MEKVMSELSGFKFKHALGQNFITDTNLLKAIVGDSGITSDSEVLEIGAGAGTLTRQICGVAKKVVSYEVDNDLKEILSNLENEMDNLQVVFNDVMKVDLDKIESEFTSYSLVANLPYYITTPILFKFLESKKIKSICVMVQKEVADRMVAKPDTKDYGTITPIIDYYGRAEIKRIVSRNMFTPAPNVDSAIVTITFEKRYDCDEEVFKKVVHSAFAMRRKTLANNLMKSFNLSREQVERVITGCGLESGVRGEKLSTQNFVELASKLKEENLC